MRLLKKFRRKYSSDSDSSFDSSSDSSGDSSSDSSSDESGKWCFDDSSSDSDEERRTIVAEIIHQQRTNEKQSSGPQGAKPNREIFNWSDHIDRLSPAEFRLRYRITLSSFELLLGWLKSKIETKNKLQARRSRKAGEVTPETRLAIALRYFAGGAVEDFRLIYHVSKTQCDLHLECCRRHWPVPWAWFQTTIHRTRFHWLRERFSPST